MASGMGNISAKTYSMNLIAHHAWLRKSNYTQMILELSSQISVEYKGHSDSGKTTQMKGRESWHHESHGRLHCIIQPKQDLRLRSNCSRNGRKTVKGIVQRGCTILQLPKWLHNKWSSTWGPSKIAILSWAATAFVRMKKETHHSVWLFPNLRILKAPNPHSHALHLLEILNKCHQMAKITHT